jgi:cob(I)alamin adenosyltransferase
MRIYTKTGDDGTTGLFGGTRVDKDAESVEAFGTVDELNSILGVARAVGLVPEIDVLLTHIQDDLLCVGAELATTPGHEERLSSRRVGEAEVQALEAALDRIETELPELKNFVLPGGTLAAATLHHARTVCRRAERRVISARKIRTLSPGIVIYLNRLSDLLFVLARRVNQLAGRPDVLWSPRKARTATPPPTA